MSKEVEKVAYVRYGSGHTKLYTKSVVADFLCNRSDDEENETHFISDIHLLLRQKKLHDSIGVDALRAYLESIDNGTPQSHNFTDEELFQLIEPKGLNTITDRYQFAKYLQANQDDIKQKYENLKSSSESYKSFIKKRDDLFNSIKST